MSNRSQIIDLIERGALPAENIDTALTLVKVLPDNSAWRAFIDKFLLFSGGMSLAAGVIFFFAYNWAEFGRFAKFTIAEVLIVLSVLAYWRLDSQSLSAKVALLVSTLLLGVLLALYGQIYQTGADPWQLFFYWALLMLPWALIGQFVPIWLVWVSLLNLALMQYHLTFRSTMGLMQNPGTEMLWWLFLFNTGVLLMWEYLATSRKWLAKRWAARLIGWASGSSITYLVLSSIFSYESTSLLSIVVWIIWLLTFYQLYRRIWPDLFMLAGLMLSFGIVAFTFFARHMITGWNAPVFLLLAIIIIGMGTGASIWLKRLQKEMQA